jgi:hypothetical protein
VRRTGARWKIEENNEQAKQITGLGQHQVRRRNSWHRHITCTMFAPAFPTVQRARRPGPGQAPAPEHDAVSGATPEQGHEQGKAGQARETDTHH